MLIPKSLEEDHDEKIVVFLNFLLKLLLLGKLWKSKTRKTPSLNSYSTMILPLRTKRKKVKPCSGNMIDPELRGLSEFYRTVHSHITPGKMKFSINVLANLTGIGTKLLNYDQHYIPRFDGTMLQSCVYYPKYRRKMCQVSCGCTVTVMPCQSPNLKYP